MSRMSRMSLSIPFTCFFALGLVYIVVGQVPAPSGPVTKVEPFTTFELRLLRLDNPVLLELAARINTRIFVEFSGPEMQVIVQENVNVNFDCLPWLSNFPGGSIRWLSISLNPADLSASGVETELVSSNIIRIGGRFNRWLNITGTLIVQGAGDPHYGNYTCEVCEARGTPREICHRATTTLFIAGSPPNIIEGQDNDPDMDTSADLSYRVGTDFCINRDDAVNIDLSCGLESFPAVVPTSVRTWIKDREEIYSALTDTNQRVNASFYAKGTGNEVFDPSEINSMPDVLGVTSAGIIRLTTRITNVSMGAQTLDVNLSPARLQGIIVDNLLGDWFCEARNANGADNATTTIRLCEGAPTFPGCSLPAIFPQNMQVVPVGCTVCIPQGSTVTLDCTATTPTQTISYEWTDPEGRITPGRFLTISMEGSYSCRASNLDNPNITMTSVLVYSSSVIFSGRVMDAANNSLEENGCERLLEDLSDNTTDLCVFIGDTLDLNCIDVETGARLNPTSPDGTPFGTSPRVIDSVAFDGVFECRLNTSDLCGSVATEFRVQVFDPARIAKSGTNPINGSIGVGRSTDVQVVTPTDSVILSCPSSGVNDPTTEWFFVSINEDGCVTEVPVGGGTDVSGGISGVTTSVDGTVDRLDISSYNSSIHDGTYVCRTRNIAGRDAGVVVLRGSADGINWEMDNNFGECTMNCRDGMQARSVTCRNQVDTTVRPNSECDAGTRPVSVQTCNSTFPFQCLLTPIFGHGEYSPCSKGCEGGYQRRDVFCFVPMTNERLPDYMCYPLRRPRKLRFCRNTCCNGDLSSGCKALENKDLCARPSFQQHCCWTCRIFA